MSRQAMMAAGAGTPAWNSQPKAQAAEPHDRCDGQVDLPVDDDESHASATITFSIESWNMLIWFCAVRKNGLAMTFAR
jgi:hypothetical protein